MTYTRMFSASCDKCGVDYDEGHWYKADLVYSLNRDDWKANLKTVLCPVCKLREMI